MVKLFIGLLIGFAVGAVCRWFELPVPAPPSLYGALLVVSVTLGFVLMDAAMAGRGNTPEEPVAAVSNTP